MGVTVGSAVGAGMGVTVGSAVGAGMGVTVGSAVGADMAVTAGSEAGIAPEATNPEAVPPNSNMAAMAITGEEILPSFMSKAFYSPIYLV